MTDNNVIRYAVLAISAHKDTAVFQQDYLAGLAALGLYELERQGAISWEEKSVYIVREPLKVPDYLRPLCEAIGSSNGRTIESVLFTMFTKFIKDYVAQVEAYLIESGMVIEKTVKNRLGIERRQLEVNGDYAEMCKTYVLSLCSDVTSEPYKLILVKTLVKTGLIYECFNKQEAKSIKEAVETAMSSQTLDTCDKTLDMIDKACTLCMAALATIMLA